MRHPYPNYKPSGVEWLGDVPEHWEVQRLIRSVDRSETKVDPTVTKETMPAYVGLEHVTSWTGHLLSLDSSQEPESLCNSFMVGDVLFAKLRPYLAKAFCADFDGLCSTEFLTLKPFNYEQRYLLYVILTDGFISFVDSSTCGARMPRANWEFIGSAKVPIPPLDEQRAIANFLDRETGKIDLLVAKKRQLLDRLGEYRTALITRTVTKGLPPEAAKAAGLDPSPKLKPSGVEWLGDVPAHWEVQKLGRLGFFFKGGGGTKKDEIEGGLPCIRYGDLYTQYQFLIKDSQAGIAEANTSKYRQLKYGDLLFAGSGETIEEIGKSAVNLIDGPVYCGGDVIGFRSSQEMDPTFLSYTADCSHSTYQKACMGRGVTIMHIYSNELKHLLIPLPPISEQRAIAAFLDKQTERVDLLCARVEVAIERLQEYRTALITAAVTGGIDVRDCEQAAVGVRRV